MYFIRGKFKNVTDDIHRAVIKNEVKKIRDDDIIYVFDDGYYVHQKTGIHQYISSESSSKEEMLKIGEIMFNKKFSLIYKPSTELQRESSAAEANMPAFVMKHRNVFKHLINANMQSVSRANIADILKTTKQDAGDFIKTAVKKGILIKYYTYWRIPQTVWINLRTMLGKRTDYEVPSSTDIIQVPDSVSASSNDEKTMLWLQQHHVDLWTAVNSETRTLEEAMKESVKRKKHDEARLRKQSHQKKQKPSRKEKLKIKDNLIVRDAATVDPKKTMDPDEAK